ncbi:nitroreductase family protein [Bifidobacterium cebidarum]|uniref:Nitroreductase n=1 Tax=Bifidobacterium cebidarum TaxID=2650773 RepID=A0A6I1G9B9_9BIFI|nr:nitroreductase family protein [Bifidobacterium cebidarum]KAB7788120.1 nitroreductase [Bifidobacterium cebidarum]
MKQIIKKFIPVIVFEWRANIRDWRGLMSDTATQRSRFAKYHSRPNSTGRGQIETQIMFHTHQIEKGLSHENFRPGFGKGVLKAMATLLTRLQQTGDDAANTFVYQQAISALHEYVKRHHDIDYDLTYMRNMFPDDLWNAICNTDVKLAGVLTLGRTDKVNNRHVDFKTLAECRYAIREYTDQPVTKEELDEAVDISMKTPSVCNRQATRIYEILNPQTIQTLLDIQGGYRGYPTPPALVLVTSDIRAFMNHMERNEPFVDGGLFSMSLLYALEYVGLAACPLNAMFSRKQDEQTRKILNIPDYELPVMYIAIGHYPEHARVCQSQRYPAQYITTTID